MLKILNNNIVFIVILKNSTHSIFKKIFPNPELSRKGVVGKVT